jgi:integrase
MDVHGLRHTSAILLARNRDSPGVAQKLMRHSDIRLTINTYTHLGLADTAGAVAALPAF